MENRQIICRKCGNILYDTGTTQTGKYKKCNNCKVIAPSNGKET